MLYIADTITGNLVGRALAVTPSPALDAIFGALALSDGRAKTIAKFGSLVADSTLTFDLALLDGSMDTWASGVPAGFSKVTTGTGTVVQTSTAGEFRTGSAAKANKGTGTAQLVRTIAARSGERLTLDVWLRIAAAGQSKLSVQDLLTRKYLTAGGAWQAAQIYCATEIASAAYLNKVVPFQVENALAHGYLENTTLRILWEDTGAGGGADFAFVDDLYLYPTWNFCSIHGHNIDPGCPMELRSDTAAFAGAGTLEATFTVGSPSFYAYLANAVAKRWARVKIAGTNNAIPWMGELVLGYAESAARKMNDGWEVRELESQVRNITPTGEAFPFNRTLFSRRSLRPSFQALSDPQFREARDDMFRRCRGGAAPLLIVPVDNEDVVVLGRIDDTIAFQRVFKTSTGQRLTYDLSIAETPFPSVVS